MFIAHTREAFFLFFAAFVFLKSISSLIIFIFQGMFLTPEFPFVLLHKAVKNFLPASSMGLLRSMQLNSSVRLRVCGHAIQSADAKVKGPQPRSVIISPDESVSFIVGSKRQRR